MNISVLDELGFPRVEQLQHVNEVQSENGTPDYINALLVGIQMIKEEVAARRLQTNQKRIVLISSFDYQVSVCMLTLHAWEVLTVMRFLLAPVPIPFAPSSTPA